MKVIIQNFVLKTKQLKWKIHWSIFAILVIILVLLIFHSEKSTWIKDMIQTITTITGIYLSLIIFLQSKQSE